MPNQTEKSHAVKMLELIEARLEGRVLKEYNEYSIAGRSLKEMSMAELMVARDKYRRDVAAEKAAENIGKGLGNPYKVRVRL